MAKALGVTEYRANGVGRGSPAQAPARLDRPGAWNRAPERLAARGCGNAVRAAVFPLSRALAEQDDAHGLEEDDEVEQQRMVLDVVKVVFELVIRILD